VNLLLEYAPVLNSHEVKLPEQLIVALALLLVLIEQLLDDLGDGVDAVPVAWLLPQQLLAVLDHLVNTEWLGYVVHDPPD
jgi:hypothetical protein